MPASENFTERAINVSTLLFGPRNGPGEPILQDYVSCISYFQSPILAIASSELMKLSSKFDSISGKMYKKKRKDGKDKNANKSK